MYTFNILDEIPNALEDYQKDNTTTTLNEQQAKKIIDWQYKCLSNFSKKPLNGAIQIQDIGTWITMHITIKNELIRLIKLMRWAKDLKESESLEQLREIFRFNWILKNKILSYRETYKKRKGSKKYQKDKQTQILRATSENKDEFFQRINDKWDTDYKNKFPLRAHIVYEQSQKIKKKAKNILKYTEKHISQKQKFVRYVNNIYKTFKQINYYK